MDPNRTSSQNWTLSGLTIPAKALVTCIILTLALGMAGAMGQIVVHDIIPTFFTPGEKEPAAMETGLHGDGPMPTDSPPMDAAGRGDLFADLTAAPPVPDKRLFYQNEQFVWTLKWTHIHLFAINAIFIVLGGITLLLNLSARARTWLIVLPFVGVAVDIAAMWLKAFVSDHFFWLHLPGGILFGGIFIYVVLRALWEMWRQPNAN